MVGRHALADQLTAWTIATQARCGMLDEARAALTHQEAGEIRNAAAAVRLAEGDPAGARRELPVPDGTALTRIETHLLDALACHDLGDRHAASAAVERALDLAERDRLILPFAMTRAWELLESLRGSSHAAFVADILDAVHDRGAPGPAVPRPAEDLSRSELRVLRYLPTNLTRPEIAGELSVSVNTVNTHIRRIYAKLGATDRSSAVRRGRELRLLASRG
jgi:LuxR family maltose regulon positive regulatory protein